MADTPYTGEFVAGDVMPTSGVTYDLSQLNQSVQSLVEANAQRKILEEKQKERERKQRLDWDRLDLDAVAVWQQDQDYVDQKSNEYAQYVIELEQKYTNEGPSEITNEEKKELRRLQQEVEKAKKTADDNQRFWDDISKKMQSDKEGDYDPETFDSFKEGYLSPSLDPFQREIYRSENDPFIRDYNWDQILDYTIPRRTSTETGRMIVSEYKPEDQRALIEGLFAAGDTKVLDMFWARKRDKDAKTKAEKGENYDESKDGYTAKQFTEEAVGLGKTKYNYSQSEEEIKTVGGTRGGGGRGGNKTKPEVQDTTAGVDTGSDPTYYDPNYKPKRVTGVKESLAAINITDGGQVYESETFKVIYFTRDSSGNVWAYGTVDGKYPGWANYNDNKDTFTAAKYPDMNNEFTTPKFNQRPK